MLIIGITDPSGRKTYIAGAFPSACGKTNLAMLVPHEADRAGGLEASRHWGTTSPGCKFGPDGRLYAVNPEPGFFGVAPGTSLATNPNAMLTCRAQHDLHQRRPACPTRPSGGREWTACRRSQAVDWKGQPWTPASKTPAAHPNSRFTAPASQCPSISPDWEKPEGVPIDAILFGGRRTTTIPLVYEAFHWRHGTFVGASMTSEKTAAAEGKVGELRHDPMAMLPFCGYSHGRLLAALDHHGRARAAPACRGCFTSTGSARIRPAVGSGRDTARTCAC